MKSAGVAQLKAKLSHYLDQVKAGQEVVVTERGRPVARLVPLEGRQRLENRGQRLAKAGLLQPARKALPRSFFSPPKGNPKVGSAVLAALLDERQQGR